MANVYGDRATSGIGEAIYVYVNTRSNVYEGQDNGYSITIKFKPEYTEKLKAQLEAFLEEVQKSEDGSKKKWSRNPVPGYSELEDGSIVFKFKAKRKDKAGEWIKVPLVDSKNNVLDPMTSIGSGSSVRVMFTPAVHHNSSTNNGVTLYLDKIQIVNLVEYAGTSAGFDEVEGGFVAESKEDSFDELPNF